MEKKTKPFKNTKRFLSLLLVFSLAFSVLPTSVFAAETKGESGVQPMPSSQTAIPFPTEDGKEEKYPAYNEAGYVNMVKSAGWTDGKTKTTADVKFDIFGSGVETGVDAVIVFDRSGSMADAVYVPTGKEKDCFGTYNYYKLVCNKNESHFNYGKAANNAPCPECKRFANGTLIPNKDTVYCSIYKEDAKLSAKHSAPVSEKGKGCKGKVPITERKVKMSLAKEAATSFVNIILGDKTGGVESDNRVALVSFSEDSKRNADFTGQEGLNSEDKLDGKGELNSKITNLSGDGGTNYTVALTEAQNLINGRTDKSRPVYVIFLTDGEPDVDSRIDHATEAEDPKVNGTDQAKAIKTAGAEIYPIAFCLDTDIAKTLLGKIATDADHFKNVKDTDDLTATFNSIAGELKKAGTDVTITDYINPDFVFDNSKKITIKGVDGKDVAGATSKVEGQKVTVTFPEILDTMITVTIPIILTEANKNKDGIYHTNDLETKAIVEYKNFDKEDSRKIVDSPVLAKPLGMITYDYYLVNQNGEPISVDGEKLPFEARIILKEEMPFTFNGSAALLDNLYDVKPEESLTVNGKVYKPQGNFIDNTNSAYGGAVKVNVVDNGAYKVHFGYTEVETVELTFDANATGAGFEKDAVTKFDLEKGTTLNDLKKAEPKVTYKYHILKGWNTEKDGKGTAFATDTKIDKDTTVYAQWEKDPEQWLEEGYEIEYFLQGADDKYTTSAGDTVEVEESTVVPQIIVLETEVQNKYLANHKGYSDGIILDMSNELTKENKTIKVGYPRNADQWLSYTINYYKDSVNGELIKTFTPAETAKVLTGTIIDPEIVKNTPEFYGDGKLATGSSTKITTDGQVINVVYTAEQWNYTVEHYKEGITTPFAVEKDLKIAKHTPSVTSVSDKASDAQGYKRNEAKLEEILPYTITKEDNVIKVYYVVDTSKTTPYKVEYFTKDGDTETSLDAGGRFVGGTVPTATLLLEEDDKTALKSAKEKPPVGYKVSETELPTTVEKDGKTVIKIVYEKDPAQWASYTVEYRKETGDKVYTAIDGSKKEVKDILLKKGEDTLAEFDVAAYHKDIEATHDTGSITTGDEGRKLTSGVNTFIVDYPAKSYPYTINFLPTELKIEPVNGTFKSYATPKTYSQDEAIKNAPTGYEFEKADKELSFTFSATESVLNITYKKVIKYGTYKIEYSWEDKAFDTIKTNASEPIEVGNIAYMTDIQRDAHLKNGYMVKSFTESIDIKEGDDNVLKVVYEKDPAQWASYTVEYYQDTVVSEKMIGEPEKGEIYVGTDGSRVIPFSLELRKPTGGLYDSGKVDSVTGGTIGDDGKTVTSTANETIIKVLYLPTAPTEFSYTVKYVKVVDGKEEDVTPIEGSFVGGKFTAESPTLTEEDAENLDASITANTPSDDEYDFTTEIDRSTDLTDKAVYKVVYTPKKEIVGDIIPVIHEYYLRGSTSPEVTFDGETGAKDGETVNTVLLRRLNGYTYTSTLITSVLKDAVAPINEIQERIAKLDANIEKNQAIIDKASGEDAAKYDEYLSLQDNLVALRLNLQDAINAEKNPPLEGKEEVIPETPKEETKLETPITPETPKEETKLETPITPETPKEETKPENPKEEVKPEPTPTPTPDAPAVPNNVSPMSVRFVSDVKSPVVEESTPPAKEENPPTLEIKPLPVAPTQSVEDIQADIDLLKKAIAKIEEEIPELIAAHKAIAADTVVLEEASVELIVLEEEMNATSSIVPGELSETETSTNPTFKYDVRYTYTITIRYDRTVAPVVPPVTPPEPPYPTTPTPTTPDTTPVDDGQETTDIFDEPIPLAKLPDGPDDIIEILDEEIPLGVLPVSGGLQGKGLATAGLLALVAAALLKLKKKDED